ncbi:MAG: hypothetical protein QM741_18250 [Rudaea sp.]|uniref:hypothetical protein n=1 Tax=Rudaea sp. TaxID=2136325 RepID=UPI0039E2747C
MSEALSVAYEAASGLLVSERIQSGASVNQDLRTLYDRDAYGNRTAAYQCSSNVTDTQCRAGATNGSVAQRQSGTTVLRYARTSYDSLGRYVTASRLPFATTAGGWNEQQATQVTARDEFGNATGQSAINGTTQAARFGVLGRPYFTKDNLGHASTTTFRLCGSGANCGTDPRFKFRAQTITAGSASSWTYFDVLGRPVMTVAQAFDSNPTTQQFTATCAFTDAHNRPTYQSEPFFLNATVSGDGSPTISGAACGGASYATTTAYDVLGRALTVTTPDGTTTNQYVGLSTFVTNARGYSGETIVNPMGEAVQTLDPGTVNGEGFRVGGASVHQGAAARDGGAAVDLLERRDRRVEEVKCVVTSVRCASAAGVRACQHPPDAGGWSIAANRRLRNGAVSKTYLRHCIIPVLPQSLGLSIQLCNCGYGSYVDGHALFATAVP